MSVDPDLGTIYSVAVPVRRVKPQARVPLDGEGPEGAVSLMVRAPWVAGVERG